MTQNTDRKIFAWIYWTKTTRNKGSPSFIFSRSPLLFNQPVYTIGSF